MALPSGITPIQVNVGIASFFDGTIASGRVTISAPVNVIHTPTNRPIFSSDMTQQFVDGVASFNLCPTDAPGLNNKSWTYKLKVEVTGANVQPEVLYFPLPAAGPAIVDLDSLVTVPSSAGVPISVPVVTSVNGQTGDVTVTGGTGGSVVDATTSVKGVVQLAGDLGGTAAAPTVPGLAGKVNSSTYTAGLAGKVDTLIPTATKTAAYTVAVGELAVMNTAAGATALTLPTAPADKAQVGFRAVGATTATPLVVTRGGTDTIGDSGATSVSLPLSGEVTVYQYQATGTRWLPVSNVKPLAALDGRYVLGTALAPTSEAVQALAGFPVGSGMTLTLQTGAGDIASAQSTVTGTLVTPLWAANTAYAAGATLLHPTNEAQLITRTTAGTSRATFDTTEQALWTNAPLSARATFPGRFNCAFLRRRQLNGIDCYGPRAQRRSGTYDTSAQINGVQWSVDFDVIMPTGGAFEVPIYSTAQIRVIVDGRYISATPTFLAGADDFQWRNAKVAGIPAGYHRVRVEIGGLWGWIGGVRVATADRLLPPTTPDTKMFAILGDSYVEGAVGVASSGTAVQDIRGFAAQTARVLGFTDYRSLGYSATGFTTPTGQEYSQRIQDIIDLQPDYLLIQGSGNDNANRDTTLAGAALSLYQAVKAGCPNTKIVASGVPGWTATLANSNAMTATLKAQAATAGIDFLDTTDWAVAVPALISDNNHPSYEGAEYLARRFAAGLASRWHLDTSRTEAPAQKFAKVIHGATATVARPNAEYVLWEGSVQPTNWIDGDDWNQV